ncbi:hypothetical protein JCM10450v2_006229 [Rhodotorula kratochvilovae]
MASELLAPLDTAPSASSGSSTPTASTSPSSAPSHQASSRPEPPHHKRVSFCPLALLIGVAADGETEPALVKAAQEHLGRRKVAIHTYSFEAPQIGDVTAKAWHSVVNGFTASLEPFLHGGGGSGSVCTRTGGRERDHSPDSAGGRRRASSLSRSRSRSPSPGRASCDVPTFDPNNDPSFIPNSPTRLTVKLPALRRECLRSFATSPCAKSILRRCTGDLPSHCPSRARPAAAAGEDAPLFPTLSRSVSTPPRAASTHADDPAALGALVPLAPCCAACESATHYGLCAAGSGDGAYRERWSAGAKKKRAEEKKEREERERCAGVALKIKARYESTTAEAKEVGEEREAEQAEEEARGSRLGLLAAKGGVDELSRERGRRGTPGALADGHHGYDDVDTVAVVVAQSHVPGGACEPAHAAPPPTNLVASVITEEPDEAVVEAEGEDSTPSPVTPAALLPADSSLTAEPSQPAAASFSTSNAPQPPRPSLPSTTSAPAALPTASAPPALPSLSRTTSPAAAPARPPKRRLSSAAASFSRVAAALGHGLMQNSGAGGGAGAGVRV